MKKLLVILLTLLVLCGCSKEEKLPIPKDVIVGEQVVNSHTEIFSEIIENHKNEFPVRLSYMEQGKNEIFSEDEAIVKNIYNELMSIDIGEVTDQSKIVLSNDRYYTFFFADEESICFLLNISEEGNYIYNFRQEKYLEIKDIKNLLGIEITK